MNKPQGYLRSAAELLFFLLVLGSLSNHSLFYASLSAVIFYCVPTFLLLFLAKRSHNRPQAIRRSVPAFCPGTVLPQRRLYSFCFVPPPCITQDSFLTPFSKRPPLSLLSSRLESRPLHTRLARGILETTDIRSRRRRLFDE